MGIAVPYVLQWIRLYYVRLGMDQSHVVIKQIDRSIWFSRRLGISDKTLELDVDLKRTFSTQGYVYWFFMQRAVL